MYGCSSCLLFSSFSFSICSPILILYLAREEMKLYVRSACFNSASIYLSTNLSLPSLVRWMTATVVMKEYFLTIRLEALTSNSRRSCCTLRWDSGIMAWEEVHLWEMNNMVNKFERGDKWVWKQRWVSLKELWVQKRRWMSMKELGVKKRMWASFKKWWVRKIVCVRKRGIYRSDYMMRLALVAKTIDQNNW